MKWGFLGYGHIAPKVHESLSIINNQELVAVASQSNHATLRKNLNNHISVYDNYIDLCNDPEIDIIYISSTHNFHFDHTMMCLHAGKHVICEKPLSLNLAQSKIMIQKATSTQLFLMEALWMAYLPAVVECKRLIESGVIGSIRYITADFSFDCGIDETHRCLNPQLAGGGVYDVGVYPIAFANMMIGMKPSNVQSTATLSKDAIDHTAAIQLQYPDGSMAQLFCGVQLDTAHQAIIYGTEGYIVFPKFWKGESFTIVQNAQRKEMHLPYKSTGYYHELVHACQQIANNKQESEIFGWQQSLEQAGLLDIILDQIKYNRSTQ